MSGTENLKYIFDINFKPWILYISGRTEGVYICNNIGVHERPEKERNSGWVIATGEKSQSWIMHVATLGDRR